MKRSLSLLSTVIGVEDAKWGERPLALVVLKTGLSDELSAEAIKAIVQEAIDKGLLPRFATPDQVLIVDSIAKTSVNCARTSLDPEKNIHPLPTIFALITGGESHHFFELSLRSLSPHLLSNLCATTCFFQISRQNRLLHFSNRVLYSLYQPV